MTEEYKAKYWPVPGYCIRYRNIMDINGARNAPYGICCSPGCKMKTITVGTEATVASWMISHLQQFHNITNQAKDSGGWDSGPPDKVAIDEILEEREENTPITIPGYSTNTTFTKPIYDASTGYSLGKKDIIKTFECYLCKGLFNINHISDKIKSTPCCKDCEQTI